MPSGWLNIESQDDSVFGGEESAYSKLGLTKKQRLYGFIGCTAAGFILSLLGTIVLFIGGLITFAILFSIGIVISLIGTGFLMYVLHYLALPLFIARSYEVKAHAIKTVRPLITQREPTNTHVPSCLIARNPRNPKQMFKPVRVGATLILLGAIAMTFMGAFLLNNAVLCLVMVIVEYLAYIWYCLSYIPYARNLVKNLLPSFLRFE